MIDLRSIKVIFDDAALFRTGEVQSTRPADSFAGETAFQMGDERRALFRLLIAHFLVLNSAGG